MNKKLPRVALIIECSHTYGRDLVRGIMRYSRMHGPWVFPCIFYKEDLCYIASEYAELEQLRRWCPDGIVSGEYKDIVKLTKLHIPLFILSGINPPDSRRNNIQTDDFAIGRMAAEHLLERGFRHFGFCGFDDMFWSQKRCESFSARIAEAGFQTNIYKQPKSRASRAWDIEEITLAKWLMNLPNPVGIMACNDTRGQHVVEACAKAKLDVPYQAAIIGVDNDDLICNIANPQLSSIAMDVEKAGFQASELLGKMMAGKKMPPQTVIIRPTRVVTRQSTNIVAVDDALVSLALHFIHQNANRPIKVNDVIKALKVSRNCLNGKFVKTLRRSVYDEIRRVRIDLIGQMLLETHLPVSDIALSLGYNSTNHIARYFKHRMGMSPQEYRKLRGHK